MLKLNLGAGHHPLAGFVNLDPDYEADGRWSFEDGLRGHADESVDAITISHALMFLRIQAWPEAFAEFARVLKPGGVLRITEDSTDDRASERYGGHHDAVTLTSLALVSTHLRLAGLEVCYLDRPSETNFRDGSLVQEHHGKPPKVFHVEGVKP